MLSLVLPPSYDEDGHTPVSTGTAFEVGPGGTTSLNRSCSLLDA